MALECSLIISFINIVQAKREKKKKKGNKPKLPISAKNAFAKHRHESALSLFREGKIGEFRGQNSLDIFRFGSPDLSSATDPVLKRVTVVLFKHGHHLLAQPRIAVCLPYAPQKVDAQVQSVDLEGARGLAAEATCIGGMAEVIVQWTEQDEVGSDKHTEKDGQHDG